jgi:septum site-determining protein MinD
MIGFISSKSHRAKTGKAAVVQRLLITRYDPERAEKGESLSLTDIQELLGLPLLGVIPESKVVLTSTNLGQPVILSSDNAGQAYKDLVSRFLGEDVPLRFVTVESKSLFSRIFGG